MNCLLIFFIFNHDFLFRWLIYFYLTILVTEYITCFRINYLIVVLRAYWFYWELFRGLNIANLTSIFKILCRILLFYQLLSSRYFATFLFWSCTFVIMFCYWYALTINVCDLIDLSIIWLKQWWVFVLWLFDCLNVAARWLLFHVSIWLACDNQ